MTTEAPEMGEYGCLVAGEWRKTGRTVEKAGIAGLSINEVNQFLRAGHLR